MKALLITECYCNCEKKNKKKKNTKIKKQSIAPITAADDIVALMEL